MRFEWQYGQLRMQVNEHGSWTDLPGLTLETAINGDGVDLTAIIHDLSDSTLASIALLRNALPTDYRLQLQHELPPIIRNLNGKRIR